MEKLLMGCVECLRISESLANAASSEAEKQKDFEELSLQPMYNEWLAMSKRKLISTSGDAAAWKERAHILYLEAKKLGYNGDFDRIKIKSSPPLAAPKLQH